MITHLVALSTCAGAPDLQVVEKLLANTAVQRRIICRFLPGRNLLPVRAGVQVARRFAGNRLHGAQRKRSEGSWAEAPCRALRAAPQALSKPVPMLAANLRLIAIFTQGIERKQIDLLERGPLPFRIGLALGKPFLASWMGLGLVADPPRNIETDPIETASSRLRKRERHASDLSAATGRSLSSCNGIGSLRVPPTLYGVAAPPRQTP